MVELSDIVGQDQALQRLVAAMGSQRPPHAWIFAGPAGVGRRTTAWALAKWLLCAQPAAAGAGRPGDIAGQSGIAGRSGDTAKRPAACGRCPSCRAFDSGTHGDFHAVTKELARYSEDPEVRKRIMQNLGIEVVREFIIAPARRTSTLGRGRVFVIQEAELMSEQAQNALLKTLEEPPPGVRLILLCRTEQELLPTTRSRCALVRFAPLEPAFVEQKLVAASIEPAEAAYWARQSAGSLGESLRLAQAGLYAIKREMLERLAALPQSADAELGDWFSAKAEELSNADQAQAVARLAGRFDLDTAAQIVSQLGRYEQLLWRNVNAKVLWDNVLITCDTAAPLEV
jgi:DNA polymerase-3 subunit delta'